MNGDHSSARYAPRNVLSATKFNAAANKTQARLGAGANEAAACSSDAKWQGVKDDASRPDKHPRVCARGPESFTCRFLAKQEMVAVKDSNRARTRSPGDDIKAVATADASE